MRSDDKTIHVGDEFERIVCPLCGRTETSIIGRKGQFGLPVFVSICPNDGLVFLNPRWRKQRYDEFYRRDYDRYYRSKPLNQITEDEKYENARAVYVRAVAGATAPIRSVLDIGAGMGWTLSYLRRKVNTVTRSVAVEPSTLCREHLAHEAGVEVLAGDVDSDWWTASPCAFDLIVMRHVLEHLMDPLAVLRNVSKALSDTGLLYLAVPDMMNPKRSLNYFWFRAVHTFYFSRATLEAFTQRGGLETVAMHEEKNGEIWGLFARSNDSVVPDLVNVYREQMSLIRRYRVKACGIDLKRSGIGLIKAILPKRVTDLLRHWLKGQLLRN